MDGVLNIIIEVLVCFTLLNRGILLTVVTVVAYLALSNDTHLKFYLNKFLVQLMQWKYTCSQNGLTTHTM